MYPEPKFVRQLQLQRTIREFQDVDQKTVEDRSKFVENKSH